MRRDFTWHRKCTHSSEHCCSEELANNTATVTQSLQTGRLERVRVFFKEKKRLKKNISIKIMSNDFMIHDWLRNTACLPPPDTFITMG
jgi:hypothetical protein